MRPAGSVNSTVGDMANLLTFFINRGEFNHQRILSPTSLKRMEIVVLTDGAKVGLEVGYGLTNVLLAYKQWLYRSHRGGVNGSSAQLDYLVEEQVAHVVVVMVNLNYHYVINEIVTLIREYETSRLPPKKSIKSLIQESVKVLTAVQIPQRSIAGIYQPLNSRFENFQFLNRLFLAEKLWYTDQILNQELITVTKPLMRQNIVPWKPVP